MKDIILSVKKELSGSFYQHGTLNETGFIKSFQPPSIEAPDDCNTLVILGDSADSTQNKVGKGLNKYLDAPFGVPNSNMEYTIIWHMHEGDPSLIYMERTVRLINMLFSMRCYRLAQDFVGLLDRVGFFINRVVEKIRSTGSFQEEHADARIDIAMIFITRERLICKLLDCVPSQSSLKKVNKLILRKIISDMVLPEEFLRNPFDLVGSPKHAEIMMSNILPSIDAGLYYKQTSGAILSSDIERLPVISFDYLNLPYFQPWCLSSSMIYSKRYIVRMYDQALFYEKPSKALYLLENCDTGSVKIGVSQDVSKRISQIKTSTDCKIDLIATVENFEQFEQPIHYYLYSLGYHIHGEWFKPEAKNIALAIFNDIKACRNA